ncbi:MAG: hypothetical protein ACI4TU_09560 [Candidatus Cryptobacteroides sp.]
MIRVLLAKIMNVRSGMVPLKFRLQVNGDVDVVVDTGKVVEAGELMSFRRDGCVRKGCANVNESLKLEIERYMSMISEAFLAMVREGVSVDEESLREAVRQRMGMDGSLDGGCQTLVGRFRKYLEEELESGGISQRRYRDGCILSRKLERYLVIRERPGLQPEQFTPEMVVDFEKFCVDEYLYAANPRYSALYPRDYDGSRRWPKRKLKEEPLRKVLDHFQSFWNDLVLFGEIEKSPYDGYMPWMEQKKHGRYSEMLNETVSLTMDEFRRLITTPVPERMAGVRNAFILQICLGCRGEDFKNLSLGNVAVSKSGIPYIHYCHSKGLTKDGNEDTVVIPLVRIAFDIVMRTRFDFYFGTQNAAYNNQIRNLMKFCGLTREICLYNNRSGESEMVKLCDVMSQGYAHRIHKDLVKDYYSVRGENVGARASENQRSHPLEERWKVLNWAMAQKPYRVDDNLNIIEGTPFMAMDPLVYKEQPEKLPGGRTNPYVISEIIPCKQDMADGQSRVSLRYATNMKTARTVFACEPFLSFMTTVKEDHRQWIQYGILLLRILGDFRVTFVKDCKETVYALWAAPRGYSYTVYFYVNADKIILLDASLTEKHRRMKSDGNNKTDAVRALRWKSVIGELEAKNYDAILNENYGSPGTPKREINEMRACSRYASQSLRKARLDAGMSQEDIFSTWGFKDDCGNMAHAENGTRVLPFKYLDKLLSVLGYKVVIVRPGLENWNAISRTTTLDKMFKEIGEPMKR